MPSTLGDLLPLDTSAVDGEAPMVPQGPRMGDMLSSNPAPIQSQGGVVRAGDVPSVDDMPKKAETLSDLRALFPELQNSSSGFRLLVERTHPKVRSGMKVAGVQGSFTGYHDGNDLLSTEGFEAQFGWGTYVVWVEGPSKNSVDPTTGHPKIVRKAEIKHDVPERPPMQQNPYLTPQFVMPHPANSQVELERARAEGRVMDRLAERALGELNHRPATDGGVSSIAAAAVEANSAQARIMIENLSKQNDALRDQVNSLMERLGHPQNTASDDLVRTVLSRGNSEIESMRMGYERQIDQIRQANDDRIERMRQDYDRTIERMRQDYQQREDNIRSQMQQAMYSDKTLFEDRFKHEREHLMNQIQSLRADHERALESTKNEYARNLEALRDSRDRDLEVIQGNQRLIIESKETEISRLTAENNRLQDKVASLEAKVNMPFHDKVRELQLHSQLLGIGTSSGDGEEKEEKPDMMSKVMEFASTPAGQVLASAVIGKLAGAPPQAPQGIPLPGQPQPRQSAQGQPQRRQKKQPQPQPQPQAQPQPAPQNAPQQPQPQPQQNGHVVEFLGGEQPLPNEQLRPLIPHIENSFFDASSNGASPEQIGREFYQFAEAQMPGQRVTRKLVNWIDAYNFCKILDMVSKGQRGWMGNDKVSWVKGVWEVLSRINEAHDKALDDQEEGQQDQQAPDQPQAS